MITYALTPTLMHIHHQLTLQDPQLKQAHLCVAIHSHVFFLLTLGNAIIAIDSNLSSFHLIIALAVLGILGRLP